MDIYEFASKLSELQKFTVPSHISGIQKVSEHLSSQQNKMKKIGEAIQQYYQPLNLVLPPNYQDVILHSLRDFDRIAKMLNSTMSDLSAFEFNLEDFEEEQQEERKIIKLVDNTKTIIKSIYEQHDLIQIVKPRDFEKIVAELLYDKGYKVQLTKQTCDGGYDILALKKIDGFPFKLLVECKRYKNTVGIEIIRSFCDVINRENANKGVIFTTSYFSKPSIDRQSEMGTILDLRNRDDLIEWIINYYEK